jgi:hypothetical protein
MIFPVLPGEVKKQVQRSTVIQPVSYFISQPLFLWLVVGVHMLLSKKLIDK